MSLEAILERIQAAGQAQAAEILNSARLQAQEMLDNAGREAELRRQHGYQEELAPAASECTRIHNEAIFLAACMPGQVRENFLETVLLQVREQISCVRAAPLYREALRKMLFEALPEENGRHSLKLQIMLQASAQDKDLLESLLQESRIDVQVDYTLNSWGGIIASARDGSWRVVNTIESRLERACPYLKQHLAAWIESEMLLSQSETTEIKA